MLPVILASPHPSLSLPTMAPNTAPGRRGGEQKQTRGENKAGHSAFSLTHPLHFFLPALVHTGTPPPPALRLCPPPASTSPRCFVHGHIRDSCPCVSFGSGGIALPCRVRAGVPCSCGRWGLTDWNHESTPDTSLTRSSTDPASRAPSRPTTLCLPSAPAPGVPLASPHLLPRLRPCQALAPSWPSLPISVHGHGLPSRPLLSHRRDPHDELPAPALGAPLFMRP